MRGIGSSFRQIPSFRHGGWRGGGPGRGKGQRRSTM
jgi:hypothetical protein